MHISDINPHIRHAALITSSFVMRTEPSVCMDSRLFFFDDISGTVKVGNDEYNILNNTAVFFPPETEYELKMEFHNNPEFYVFNFDLTNIHSDIKEGLGTPHKSEFDKSKVPSYELPYEFSKPCVKILPQIKSILNKCTDNFILKTHFYREDSSALLKLALMEFLKGDFGNARSELCKNVLMYIQKNYADSTVTNEHIASHFNYHPNHLSSIIKCETGKTLHQFIISYRLRVAIDLLVNTNCDISDVSWKCGFTSPAYFTKIFKQNIKMTPKEYRKTFVDIGF